MDCGEFTDHDFGWGDEVDSGQSCPNVILALRVLRGGRVQCRAQTSDRFVFGSLLLLYCAGAEGMWRLFDLVGVTEMFDEFVLLLGGAAAARPPPRARPRHVRDLSHRRPGRAAALGVLAFLPPRARPRRP